jgi:hypothetical protein
MARFLFTDSSGAKRLSGFSSPIHRIAVSDLREVEGFIGGLLAEPPIHRRRIAALRRRRSRPIMAQGVLVIAG